MLYSPFFVILVFLVHSGLRYCKFGIGSHLYEIVDGFDEDFFMFDVILKGNQNSFVLVFFLMEIFNIFIFEIIVYSLGKFFNQVYQKLKTIGIYFLQLVLQNLLIGTDQFLINKIHLCMT